MPVPVIGAALSALMSGGGGAMAAQAASQAAGAMAVGKVTSAFSAMTHPLSTVTGLVHKFHSGISTLEAPFKALEGLFSHAGQYVSKLSPIKMEFFTRAVDDFQAAIGKNLVPVIEAGIRIFRKLGDMVASNSPAFTKLAESVGKFIESTASAFMSLAQTLIDNTFLISMLTDVFETLAKVLKPLIYMTMGAMGGTLLGGPVGAAAGTAGGLYLGMQDGKKPKDSAQGMAFHSAQTENVSSMLTRVQTDAFAYGNGGGKKAVEEESRDYLKEIANYLTTDFASDVAEAIANAPRDAVRNAASDVATSVASGDALDRLGRIAMSPWNYITGS